MRNIVLAAALGAGLTMSAPAAAQGGPGFLFNNPRLSLGFRAGYQQPTTGSNIFDFPLDSLTLDRSDFGSVYLGGELSVRVADHWDVAVGMGWARSKARSEYVSWVDQDNLPIEQITVFETVSGTLGAKYFLFDRGRQIGRFAWVPSFFTPYLGGGIGFVNYDFQQAGDWVDFQTLEVFPDQLRTTGTGFAGYFAAGTEIALGRQFVLGGEARYTLSNANVGGSYVGFDRIDLSGLQLVGSLALRW